jgi:hypothetical protein
VRRLIVALLAAALMFGAGYGVRAITDHPVVCHAITEDSFPYDCDYSHGAWTPKH